MIFLLSEPPLEDVIKATITARLGQSPFLALAVDTTADIECKGVFDAGNVFSMLHVLIQARPWYLVSSTRRLYEPASILSDRTDAVILAICRQ